MRLIQSSQCVVFRNNQTSLFYKLMVLKVIFTLITLVLLIEISNSCVSGVTTENIYLLFFVVLVFIMWKAAYLLYK